MAGQLSRSAPRAAGGRNNPTSPGYKLAFTMTSQDVAALCPSAIKKIETPLSDRRYLVRHLDMNGQ
jgi:hypothetical protein